MMSQDLGVGRLHVFCEVQERSITPNGGECDHFDQTEYETQCWNDDGTMKEEYYWKLRQQITVGSCYLASYENQYGIDSEKVCNFFEGYESFLDEKMTNENGDEYCYESLFDMYDNEENLLEYVAMMYESPMKKKLYSMLSLTGIIVASR